MKINEINDKSEEGKLLLMALSKISTESQTDKTPNQILEQLDELKNGVYGRPENHEIKTFPHFFQDIISGDKTFEIRINDRDYKINDVLKLREYDRVAYTGRETTVLITYIFEGGSFGLDRDYCILGIKRIGKDASN